MTHQPVPDMAIVQAQRYSAIFYFDGQPKWKYYAAVHGHYPFDKHEHDGYYLCPADELDTTNAIGPGMSPNSVGPFKSYHELAEYVDLFDN